MVIKRYITCPSYALVLFAHILLAVTVIGTPAQAQTPVGWWKFDDGSGTKAVDSSGNGRTAALVNGVTWVTGKIGDAVSANAARKQYISIPAINLGGTRSVTVTLWANRNYSTSGGHALFEATTNYNNSTTGFGFFPDDATCDGIQAALRGNVGYVANCYSQPSSGVWHHLAVVFDKRQTGGSQVAFYVDGVLQTPNRSLYASTNTNNFGNNPIYLFSRAGSTEFSSGMLDDLRIYNSALTAQQIQQIYNNSGLVSIAVTPVTPSIGAGTQQQFTATGTYSDGTHRDLTSSATWTSSATSVATINSAGLATAVAVGNTTIQAASGSIKGSTGLTVTAPVLVSIAVTPVNSSIAAGNQQQFTATGTYSDGSKQNLTSSATWTSSATSVATINSAGLATGVAAGNTSIQAVAGSIFGSTSLTVTCDCISLDGNVHGVQDNGPSASTTAMLSIGTPTAADLIACEVSFISTGGNTLVSVADNENGTYAAAIPPHLNTSLGQWFGIYYRENVAASPTTVTLTTSQSQAYSAISCQAWTAVAAANSLDPAFGQLQDGVAMPNPTTGANQTPAVNGELVIAAVGLRTAGPPTQGASYTLIDGATSTLWWPEYWVQTTATATAGNFIWPSDSFTNMMAAFRSSTAPTLVSIAVTPANPSIAAGTQQQFTATGTYSDGSKQNLTASATWTSSATSIATINSAGLATAVAVGSTTIQATSGSINGSTGLTVTAPVLVSIAVTPANPSIAAGTQQQFTATGTYSDGSKQNLTASATWTSSATSIATINSAGLATAVAVGSTTIQATSGSINGSTGLTVTAPVLVSIAVTPANPSIAAGTQQQFTATGTYSDGSKQNLTASATWTSSATSIATINSAGLATAVAVGSTTIQATSGSINGSTGLTVTAPVLVSIAVTPANPSIAAGTQQQFTATGTYSDGSKQNLTASATWTSSATSIATINSAGLATAVAVGSTTIQATSGSINGSTGLTVTAPVLVSIAVTPANPSIAAGTQQQFTATGTYSDGSKQNLTASATWTSSATSIATINSAGLATAVAVGSTTIQATSGSINGSTGLTVTAPVLVSIAVTPANPSIAAGTQQQFTATGTYSDGSKQNLTASATWTSSATSIATINSAGLATAVAVGSTTIQATSGSINGSTGLTVTAPVLVSIAVTPANPSIAAGTQQQFTATGTYSDGSKQNLTASATWTSSATSIATINSAGLATAVAVGSTTIQATSGSINGSTGLTVTPLQGPSVALSWTASTSPGIAGYNAYRSTVSGGPYTKLDSSLISNTNYNDQTVQSGYTYYYVTTAVDSQGMESAYSNEAVATVP